MSGLQVWLIRHNRRRLYAAASGVASTTASPGLTCLSETRKPESPPGYGAKKSADSKIFSSNSPKNFFKY